MAEDGRSGRSMIDVKRELNHRARRLQVDVKPFHNIIGQLCM